MFGIKPLFIGKLSACHDLWGISVNVNNLFGLFITQSFTNSTSRLSLPMKIAPIPLGLLIDEKSDSSDEKSQTLQDLAQYVEYLLSSENIEILKQNDYQTFDDLGVPYVIVIDETCLDKGVIKVRKSQKPFFAFNSPKKRTKKSLNSVQTNQRHLN